MDTEDSPPIESELEQVYELLVQAQQERDSFRAGNTALLEALMCFVYRVSNGGRAGEIELEINAATQVLREAGMIANDGSMDWDALDARKPKRQTWAEAVHECVTDPQEIARLMALDDEHE